VRLIRTAYCHKGFRLAISVDWKTINRTSNRGRQTGRNLLQKSAFPHRTFAVCILLKTRRSNSYAGPQSRRLAGLVASNAVKIGAIHTTYLELYARTLVDLTPQVALVVPFCIGKREVWEALRIEPREADIASDCQTSRAG
jgi:hypothetical protein